MLYVSWTGPLPGAFPNQRRQHVGASCQIDTGAHDGDDLAGVALAGKHGCAIGGRTTERPGVAVCSSSSERYVEAVTAELFGTTFPVAFSWAVSKCVQKVDSRSNGYVYIKV